MNPLTLSRTTFPESFCTGASIIAKILLAATPMAVNVAFNPASFCNGCIKKSMAERKVMKSPTVRAPDRACINAKETTTATPIMATTCVTGVPRLENFFLSSVVRRIA